MPDRTTPEQQAAAGASDPLSAAPLYLANLADAAAVEACGIPVERIGGPVLLISGEDDALWPSALMGEMALERLRRAAHPYPDAHLRYPGAGHLIGYPYLPTTVSVRRHPALGRALAYGGTPVGAAGATADAWPRVLAFLRDTLQ
jgi:dienelactone hydrolase